MSNTNVPGTIKQKAPIAVGGTSSTLQHNPTTVGAAQINGIPVVIAAITLTKFQFRKLFTLNERVLIDNVASSNMLTPAQIATVTTIQKDLDSSGEVVLNSTDVVHGIEYLVQVGLLSAPRAVRILGNLQPL
jgi:hypothetical protein